jgi:hypothetical protein
MSMLRLHQPSYGPTQGPLFVEVFDDSLERVETSVVPPKETVELTIDRPGNYLLRVRRPAGSSFFHSVNVPTDAPVELEPPDTSPHEFLSYQHHLGLIRRGRLPLRKELQQGWLRFWRFNRSPDISTFAIPVIHPAPVTLLEPPRISGDSAAFEVRPELQEVRWVEVRALGHLAHLAVVPPGDRPVTIALVVRETRTSRAPDPEDEFDDVDVLVTGLGEGPEALLRYFTSNSVDASSAIAERIEREVVPRGAVIAEDMLYHKTASPVGAAIGGYYLLRVHGFDQMHDWARNLDHWFPWFPDGAVINGCHLLSNPRDPEPLLACERLVEAARRGLPVLTEGVRLLRDGLTYFARIFPWNDMPAAKPSLRHDASRALEWLGPYLDAVDWESPLTVFHARRLGILAQHPDMGGGPPPYPSAFSARFW